ETGFEQWDKRVVSLFLLATHPPRGEDRGRSVRPQVKRRGETAEVALDRGFVDIGREVTLHQQALPNDVGRQTLHAPIVAPRLFARGSSARPLIRGWWQAVRIRWVTGDT